MPVNIDHFVPQLPKDCGFNKNTNDVFDVSDDVKRLQELVFSPDPNTCNPSSDVAYMLSGSDPAFQQFLKDRLFRPQGNSLLADSPDEAAALVHKNLMTSEEYASAVRDYVVSLQQQQSNESNYD